MKGLILKDIYGCRFQIICGFAIMLFPMLMMSLAGGGMFAAGEDNDYIRSLIGILVYGVINYMSIVICSSFYLNTLKFDEASGWTKIQRAMPLTCRQIIGGKFLGVGAVVGTLTVISLAFNLVSAVIFEMPFEPMIAMPLCIGFVETMTLLPCVVLGYRFGAKSVTWMYYIVMGIIAAGTTALTTAFLVGDISTAAMRIIAYGGIPVLFAVILTVCYITGKKAVTVGI